VHQGGEKMSVTQIILIVLGTLAGLGIVTYVAIFVRVLRNTKKPIPIDPGEYAIKLVENVALTSADSTPAMDIYGPKDDPSQPNILRPLVLFVPGDGPEMLIKNAKEWRLFRSYADICASKGFAAAVMNHRSSGNYKKTEAMVTDVVNAIETLHKNASKVGIDPERVVVWTFSGSAGPVISRLLQEPVQGVRGIVSFYGMFDLSTYPFKVPAPVVQAYSLPQVLSSMDNLPCPLYLLNMGRDSKMIAKGFQNTTQVIAGRDLPIVTRIYDNGRHGFEVLSPSAETRIEINSAFEFVSDCIKR
jgi:dienelactone hydrolase